MKLSSNNFAIFTSDIISRGREYFKDGKVRIVSAKGNDVVAEVSGSSGKTYEVSLKFKENRALEEFHCTCPYKRPCKHQAAVLFELTSRETEALRQRVKSIETNPLDKIKSTISAAHTRRSLELLRKAKDELIASRSLLPLDDLEQLTALYVITLYRTYYYGGLGGGIESCFVEAVNNLGFDEERLSGFVANCLNSGSDLGNYTLGEVFNAFFSYSAFSYAAQIGFMKLYRAMPKSATDLLSSSAIRTPKLDLPIYPPFAVAMLETVPLSAGQSFYQKALETALAADDALSIKKITRYLNASHNQRFIPEAAYDYLVRHGYEDDAEALLLDAFFEYDSDFNSYLRIRNHLTLERFKQLLPRLSPALATKPFLNAVLLRDGLLFPEYLRSLSFKKLSSKEIFACRDTIDENDKNQIVALVRKRLTDCKAKSKEAITDLFYGLLYLDSLKDFYLEAALFEPCIVKSSSTYNDLRCIWLGIISRNRLLAKAGLYPYEVKYVSL